MKMKGINKIGENVLAWVCSVCLVAILLGAVVAIWKEILGF